MSKRVSHAGVITRCQCGHGEASPMFGDGRCSILLQATEPCDIEFRAGEPPKNDDIVSRVLDALASPGYFTSAKYSLAAGETIEIQAASYRPLRQYVIPYFSNNTGQLNVVIKEGEYE